MPSRRLIVALGPSLGLALLAGGIAGGCMAWSIELPSATAFVGRELTEACGVALTAAGRTQVSLLPLPRLGFSDIRLTAGDPDGPVLAEGGTLSIQLSLAALLGGRAEIVSLALDGAQVRLPASDDDTRWDGPVSRLSRLASAEAPARPRRITLSRVSVTGRDPRDGAPQSARDLDLVLSWPLWSASLDLAGGFTWNGATAHFAVTGLRPADLAAGGASPFAASAAWPAGLARAEGSASLHDGLSLTGTIHAQTQSLSETLAWIGGGMALSPLIGDIALDGRFEAGAGGLQLPAVKVTTGGMTLEGAVSAELAGRRPSVRATLAAESLDLGPLAAGAARIAGLDGSGGWGRASLDLHPLVGGDLDLRLSGTSARLGPVLLEDVATSVIVRADGIDATLRRANLEQGGTLKGRLALAAHEGRDGETEIRAHGAFDHVDLGALLAALGHQGWTLGAVHGTFSLGGKGRDADSLVRHLGGHATFAAGDGAAAALDLSDAGPRSGGAADGTRSLAFERTALALRFAEGVGEITEGTLTGRSHSATLRGQLSLPERFVRAQAEVVARGPDETAPAVFEIAGPWDAVTVRGRVRKEGAGGGFGREPSREEWPWRMPASASSDLPSRLRAYLP